MPITDEAPVRPSKHRTMLKVADVFAERSTCSRLSVGAVITDMDMSTVYSVGYNGTARGLPNGCDRETPGDCGCVHAEANALIKAPYHAGLHDLFLFCTHTPCPDCSKLIINSSVGVVYAGQAYRLNDGPLLLQSAGILVCVWNGTQFEKWTPHRG